MVAKYLGLESLYNRFMERGLESASPINIYAEVPEGRPQNEKRKQDSLPTVAKKAKGKRQPLNYPVACLDGFFLKTSGDKSWR